MAENIDRRTTAAEARLLAENAVKNATKITINKVMTLINIAAPTGKRSISLDIVVGPGREEAIEELQKVLGYKVSEDDRTGTITVSW